jgi:hypothetical protein
MLSLHEDLQYDYGKEIEELISSPTDRSLRSR